MKITILRGANLNEWEMQNYAPLAKHYSMQALVAGKGNFNTKLIGFRAVSLASPLTWARRIPGGINLLKNLYGDQGIYYGLDKHLVGNDIIHTAETYTTYTRQALDFKKKNVKTKVVATVWENIPFVHEDYPKEKINKYRAIKELDHFIAMSNKAKQALIAEGADPQKISVQFMGIDVKRFSPQEKDQSILSRHQIDPNSKIILTIARNVWEKGIDDLILAVKLIKQKGLNIHLLIIGDGPMHNKLKELSQQLKIDKQTTFVKKVDYNEIPKYHNLADVFVLNSAPTKHWQEQFGMVLIESMACQAAVISTLSGSIPEVVGDSGLLIPPADHLALKKAILSLLEDNNKRLEIANQARFRTKTVFDANKVALNIKEIYESLI